MDEWHGKALVMEIYHLAMCNKIKEWTVQKTATYFNVSIGLVSENLKLARAIHTDEKIIKSNSRQDALNKLK